MKLNQTQKLLLGVVAGMMVLVLVLSLFLFQTGTGNPTATTGAHNFTTSNNEHITLIQLGWRGEGIAWYGV